jgi:deazaflavin-dependent oxidoreductase (nitroreductase family)
VTKVEFVSAEAKDSPVGWVADHIKQYEATDGAEGHLWQGYPTLLVTVVGRKSGTPHRTALIYGRDGEDYLLVASKGGAPEHPLWYLNMAANPDVEVQVEAEKFSATARTATPEEKPRLWTIMAEVFPPYNEYQAKTDRDIPVIVLTRT